jgi:[acyl-carrier-protein] S-malonyltransferase
MESAREELASAIENTTFNEPNCPIYQNVPASAITTAEEIKNNLVAQLTAPVKWTQTIQQMIKDGGTEFTEVGPGRVLQGLMRKIDRSVQANGVILEELFF